MEIIQARQQNKDGVLKFLDAFRTYVMHIQGSWDVSHTAQDLGSEVFQEYVDSKDYTILIAIDNNTILWIITISRIPVVRKGVFHWEVQEFFVDPKLHGTLVAGDLMNAAEKWCSDNSIVSLRLESDNALKRAHWFYRKHGFVTTAERFEKTIKKLPN